MYIYVVGVNHHTSPVSIRGKLAIGAHQLKQAMSSLHEYISEGIILSTCNRTEIYALTEKDEPDVLACTNFLNARARLPETELLKHIYTYQSEEAVKHLFRVSSGLDSMITGEFEVLGQVKYALEQAKKTGLIGLPLLKLFQHAVRVGRRSRAETGISKNAVSVSSVAVDLVIQIVGDISSKKVVVVGAGEAGRLVARTSIERGALNTVVASRSRDKGIKLAEILHSTWVPMERLEQELSTCDIVVSCSGAPHPILKLDLFKDVMALRPDRPLVIIDIAVPPDVESLVRQIDNIFLYDIDDLIGICNSNHNRRRDEIQSAVRIVDGEVSRFMTYWHELEVRPIISALAQKAEKIRRNQLSLTRKKLPELPAEAQDYLEAMTKSIVQKILHEPMRHLKSTNNKRGDYIQVVNELFGLNEEKPD